MEPATSKSTFPLKSVGLWVFRALIAALFLFAGFMKLSGQPMMVAEFDQIGLGQWFRYVTGTIELIGGIAVLVPTVSALAALVLLCVDIGAFIAQVAVLHMDWIHTIVIGLAIAALAYVQRESLRRWL
jgi:uncharacterized membrane protein YphA (DoxX/SURF4 family)